MTAHRRVRRVADGAGALLMFGAGFALVWYGWSRSSSQRRAQVEQAARGTDAPASTTNDVRGLESNRVVPRNERLDHSQAERAAASAKIRKSRLPEWMRFRVERTRIALSTEMAVRFALEADAHVAETKAACTSAQSMSMAPALDISAEIEIHDRDVTVRSWGCDTESEDPRVGAACECLIQRLPAELSVAVPADVPDGDLTSYTGMLSLRL